MSLEFTLAVPPTSGDTVPLACPISGHLIAGVRFDLINYAETLARIEDWRRRGECGSVHLLNPHSVMMYHRDAEMNRAVQSAALALPDGIGIILAARLLGYPEQGRVTGPSLMLRFCDWGREHGYRHYFYGGGDGVATKLATSLKARFPGLNVAGAYQPPFGRLNLREDDAIMDSINEARPDIVWVGLGAPKQEKWMAEHRSRLNATALIGVGAAFDFHSGNIRWAPAWVRRIGMEWAWRLAREPRRMWRRNLDSPLFIMKILRQFMTEKACMLRRRA